MAYIYTTEELENIKRMIDTGKATAQQITEYGYATQTPKKVDKAKYKTGGTK
ncbi:hypothetical protein [Clostridium tagluense]|uniref:Uncharacterized protein n=1 Tax=Clostridium tagluense TaxID=360422 RepID=A0A401UTV7_9CLOT|nr:hypothetical protein [Clostridium tagluense]GCD12989.1 hypothetical protein Ctaglu_46120 [Clostridium tagluense]